MNTLTRRDRDARLSVTAAGHASGRIPAEAEATPVVADSAYRKSTPAAAALPGRRAARIKPGGASAPPDNRRRRREVGRGSG